MGKTEIYGTIGPSCAKPKLLEEMFRLGMAGVRLNLSHSELEGCGEWTRMVREAALAARVQYKLLIDLRGPELRVGNLKGAIKLEEGRQAWLEEEGSFAKGASGEGERGSSFLSAVIPCPEVIFGHLQKGQEILLDDGKIQLYAVDVSEGSVCCKVTRGGNLKPKKSIALPGVELRLPVLTESDKVNIRGAKSHGVTGVMLPFVRRAEDLKELKQELINADAGGLEVFAKIENMEGVRHLEELLPYANQIVVARGDLGNSMPLWELPVVQAKIAKKCRDAGKSFMVVTQMLASMENHPVPTRAEVSDIFRAVSEGAASVMVTGETAVGQYPREVIQYLSNTVKAAERYAAS